MKAERFTDKGFMVYLININALIRRVETRGEVFKIFTYYEGQSKGVPCTAKKYKESALMLIDEINQALA
jgi:hypothetical protein